MFGFKRRAGERAAREAAELAAVSASLRSKLALEIAQVVMTALPNATPSNIDKYRKNAAAVQRGIDAVLVEGADAFGADMSQVDQPTKCGAMLAHAARNMALLSGSLNNPNTLGDISFGILGRR